MVVGEVAYSAVFRLIFNGKFGAINGALGCARPADARLADPAVDRDGRRHRSRSPGDGPATTPIIILAGLQNIPHDLYEQAAVDGVPRWRQHLSITLPLLRPVILFALVLSIIGTMQLFAEPWLITMGGPGNATETLGTYLYRQGFTAMNFGYASVAYAVALMAAVFSAIQIMLFGRQR